MTDRNHDPKRDEKFVQDILSRTSGSPCETACDRIPALVDGELQGLDRELLQSHLEHCHGCREVAVVMGWLTPALPAMAVIDPGPAFTAAVLARTTAHQRELAARAEPVGPAGLMDRLGRWWGRQILEPLFPAQVAYTATVVMVLLTAVPGAPLKGVPGKALESLQAGPATMPVFGPAVTRASNWLDGQGGRLVDGVTAELVLQWQETESALAVRADRSWADRTLCGSHIDQTISSVREGDMGQATYELFGAFKSGGRAWKEWWTEDEDN